MTKTVDNQLPVLVTGQAGWDTDLNTGNAILERGYHITAQIGVAVNTGNVLWQNSAGYFMKFDPTSRDVQPHAMTYLAGNSGDTMTMLLRGTVRSLGINSAVAPGQPAYVSNLTPGLIVGSYSGSDRPIGFGISGWGVYFNPGPIRPLQYTTSLAIAAVTGSLHLFTVDVGLYGYNRYTKMAGNSANLVELKFFSESTRSTLLFSTLSGGVTTVGSFYDRASWPYENTDATSVNGTLYRSLKIMSAAAVGSDTISVQGMWDRDR